MSAFSSNHPLHPEDMLQRNSSVVPCPVDFPHSYNAPDFADTLGSTNILSNTDIADPTGTSDPTDTLDRTVTSIPQIPLVPQLYPVQQIPLASQTFPAAWSLHTLTPIPRVPPLN